MVLLRGLAFCLAVAPVVAFTTLSTDNSTAHPSYFQRHQDRLVSTQELDFIDEAMNIADRYDVKIAYAMCCGSHVWDHLMPMFHVLEGTLALPRNFQSGMRQKMSQKFFKQKDYHMSDETLKEHGFDLSHTMNWNEVRKFLETGRNHILLHNLDVTDMPNLHLKSDMYTDQLYEIHPGYDDDHLWNPRHLFSQEGFRNRWPSLQFSNFTKKAVYKEPNFPKFNRFRQSLLYVASYGDRCTDNSFLSAAPNVKGPCMFKSGSMQNPHILKALNLLTSTHNVIIRPHPRTLDDDYGGVEEYQKLCPNCIIDDYKNRFDPGEVAKMVETVVIEPSAVAFKIVHAAPKKKYIVMVRDVDRYNCIKPAVMNDNMATVFFPEKYDHHVHFVNAIERVRDEPKSDEKVRNRQEWFHKFYGDIDGFEEYRAVVQLFTRIAAPRGPYPKNQRMLKDVEKLQEYLKKFTAIDGRLVTPEVPRCSMECCKSTAPKNLMGMPQGGADEFGIHKFAEKVT